jgi:3-oxoadipate enol-lactonase
VATIPVPGAQLYYDLVGSGVPVVLVHGLALDSRMWDDQIPALSDIATVIRYDVRGFGQSTRNAGNTVYTHADDLWAVLDHFELQAAVLVGLSMGGRIALEAALIAPERTLSLVLLDAVLDGVPWDDESNLGMQAISEGLRSRGLTGAKEAWLRHGFFVPAQRQPNVANRLAQMVTDYSGIHWTEADPHGPHPDCLSLLSTFRVPTTVVVGELDVPCFLEMADVLASSIPTAHKISIGDAGHMVNMEAPAAVNQVLRRVVLSVEGATAPGSGD